MILTNLLNLKGIKRIFSVAAGNPGEIKLVSETSNIRIPEYISFNGNSCTTSDYEIFYVEGDSMSAEDIHKRDLLFAKKLAISDKTQIKNNDLLVFKVDKELYKKHYPDHPDPIDYKLRKFSHFIDLSLDDDTIVNNVRNVILEVDQKKYREKFIKKLARAREDFKDESLILLSITYLNVSLDFSLHPLRDLFAKIEYIANWTNKTYSFDKVVSVNSNSNIRYIQAIKYLSENKIDRYISGITEEFRANALKEIINVSESYIRGAFNKYSDVFNTEQNDVIKSFLKKENTSFHILLYTKPDTEQIEKLQDLSETRNQIIVRTSNGVMFTRDDKGITFCVGDDSMYILKPDTTQSLIECNFKDHDYCGKLIDLFDKYFNVQEEL